MEAIFKRCSGIDVHKNKAVACVFENRKKEIWEFGIMTDETLSMSEWLREKECEVVCMESTGVY